MRSSDLLAGGSRKPASSLLCFRRYGSPTACGSANDRRSWPNSRRLLIGTMLRRQPRRNRVRRASLAGLDGRLHTAATMAPLLTSLTSGYRSRGGNMDNMDNILNRRVGRRWQPVWPFLVLACRPVTITTPRVSHDRTHPSEVESYLPASQ